MKLYYLTHPFLYFKFYCGATVQELRKKGAYSVLGKVMITIDEVGNSLKMVLMEVKLHNHWPNLIMN